MGYSDIDAGNTIAHAFLYHDGVMTDLNDLINPASGWVLNNAWAVSNAGYIAGRGTVGGVTHGFVLSAMPGDANLDGTVNITDLSKVLTNYDKTGMTWADGDFNGDGTVNISDLSNVLTNYDKTAGGIRRRHPRPCRSHRRCCCWPPASSVCRRMLAETELISIHPICRSEFDGNTFLVVSIILVSSACLRRRRRCLGGYFTDLSALDGSYTSGVPTGVNSSGAVTGRLTATTPSSTPAVRPG